MEKNLPSKASPAGQGFLVRRNARRRRLAARADEPEVISSFCDGTTLVEIIITEDRNNPEERRTLNSPSCQP